MADREGNGRFAKGVSGNPRGRAPRAVERKYLEILKSICTPDEWRAVCMAALVDAKAGDAVARKWISDYLIGPQKQTTEVTGADGGALQTEIIIKYADNRTAGVAAVASKD